jgi:hypothetical protein
MKNRILIVNAMAILTLSACTMNGSAVRTDADYPLHEAADVAITPFTEIETYPEYGMLLLYSHGNDAILIYDLQELSLLHSVSFGDEVARMVYPRVKDAPVRYLYSPPDEAIYLVPFVGISAIQGHEIEAARMIDKNKLVCVMTALGPWMIDREKDNEGFGRVPVLFTYDLPTRTVSDINLLLPWMDRFIWNSISINQDGLRVAIGMNNLSRRKVKGEMKMFVQNAGSSEYLEIFEAGTEADAQDTYVYHWNGDTLYFSHDLQNVYSYDGTKPGNVVRREAMEEYLDSPYRIASMTVDVSGRLVLGLYTYGKKNKENKAVRLLIQDATILDKKEYDLNVPGRICGFRVGASDADDLMLWLDKERAYIRKPRQLETQ